MAIGGSVIDLGRFNVLGMRVNAIDYDSAVAKIMAAATAGQAFGVAAQPVHGVMTGVLNPEYGYRLNHLDLVVPDGQPVRWALNLLYKVGLKDRVYGPTLMLKLCERAAQTQVPIYLYGSRPEVVAVLPSRLQQQFPTLVIAGVQPSDRRQVSEQEQEAIVESIRATGAKLVFVGLGCPRQEIWVYENRDRLSMPAVAVGAAFDFHAGLIPQAPPWMQKRGLEWLFRLRQEPQRLWKRYMVLNPLYIGCFALQYFHLKAFTPSQIAPKHPLNYS